MTSTFRMELAATLQRPSRVKIALLILAVIVVAGVIAQITLAAGFAGKIEDARRRLVASQVSQLPDQSLIPEIVKAFAHRAGGRVNGASVVRVVQSAEMKLQADQPFFRIDAVQLSGTRDPGFVWDARGSMASVIPIRVVDSYVAGKGWLEARIAGSIPVANATGAAVSKGEAMRFLAEFTWNPDSLVNAAGLTWRQLDDATVEVTMLTEGGPATVRLLFDAAGDIVGIEADDRQMGTETDSPPTRWIGRFRDYASIGAYRVPRFGEVAWVLPAGEFVYWRGEILSLTPVPE
jgi:hypothetical protein